MVQDLSPFQRATEDALRARLAVCEAENADLRARIQALEADRTAKADSTQGGKTRIACGGGAFASIRDCPGPVRDREGHLVAGVAAIRDSVRRRELELQKNGALAELEQALADLEQRAEERTAPIGHERGRLLTLLDSIADEVWFCDAAGNLVLFNRTVEENFGLAAGEREPRSLHEYLAGFGVYDGSGKPRPPSDMPLQRSLRGETLRNVEETLLHPQTGELRYRQVTAAPLRTAAGAIVGAVAVARDVTEQRQAAAALHASHEQLQVFSRRLTESVENERRAIARELHDEAGQSLTALKLGLSRIRRTAVEPDQVSQDVADLEGIVDTVMDELHRLAMRLRPIGLDRFGLLPALRQYIETFRQQSGLRVEMVTLGLGEERLAADTETALYRLVQESLTNVARHAQATRADIILERRADQLLAIIEDDGRGFDPDKAFGSGRLGLAGMRERIEALGGQFAIESTSGHGATLFIALPYCT